MLRDAKVPANRNVILYQSKTGNIIPSFRTLTNSRRDRKCCRVQAFSTGASCPNNGSTLRCTQIKGLPGHAIRPRICEPFRRESEDHSTEGESTSGDNDRAEKPVSC